MIYVLSHTGEALMPTQRCGKVRRLLRDGLAHVVRRTPFTIRLDYETTDFTQPVTLGADVGTTHVGLSATTDAKELFCAEVTLRTDITKLLSTRLEARRTRRSRLRYRAPRFDNRRRPDGWLAPSVKQKVDSHLKLISDVHKILPVTDTVIEVAQFDAQLLKNPDIAGVQYQQGEQMGFWNVREYVLFRDGHKCQHCKGKTKDTVLNVHHIESRQTGGDSPSNLVTLCRNCHKAYHSGEIELKLKRTPSLRDAAAMTSMRWELYRKAKEQFRNVRLTYGYITKHRRIEAGFEKSHQADARCISGHPLARPSEQSFLMRMVRRHTRSLHVFLPSRNGVRRSTVASHWIGVTRLQRYDSVVWNGMRCFVSGSTNGRAILRDIDWKKVTDSASVNAGTVTFLNRKHGSMIIKAI